MWKEKKCSPRAMQVLLRKSPAIKKRPTKQKEINILDKKTTKIKQTNKTTKQIKQKDTQGL